jgi:photosystem II stability/assembly factor-like uncharacterized protein
LKTAIISVLFVLSAVAFADWTSIGPEGGPIYCGTVVPTTPPTLYVAPTSSGMPLLKSNDGGESWEPSGATMSSYPYVLVTHPTDTSTLYGAYSSIFYSSTDAGATWTTHSFGSNTYGNDIAVNPLNPEVIYVSSYKYDGTAWRMTSLKSTSGGQSWVATQIDTYPTTTVYSVAIDPVDTNVVYIGAYVDTFTVVYRSTDSGTAWTPYNLPGRYYYVYSLYVSPADHNTVFAGTLYGVCRSTDAGQTWTRQSSNTYNYRIVSVPGKPDLMYSAAYSNVYRSTDAGTTWTACGAGISGTAVRTVLTVPGESSTVYCGSTAGMFKSTDRGWTWNQINHGVVIGKIPVVSCDPSAPGTVYAEFIDNDIFMTMDDGLTWEPQNSPLSCGNVCNILFEPENPLRIWMLEASG